MTPSAGSSEFRWPPKGLLTGPTTRTEPSSPAGFRGASSAIRPRPRPKRSAWPERERSRLSVATVTRPGRNGLSRPSGPDSKRRGSRSGPFGSGSPGSGPPRPDGIWLKPLAESSDKKAKHMSAEGNIVGRRDDDGGGIWRSLWRGSLGGRLILIVIVTL